MSTGPWFDPYSFLTVTGSDDELRYWATLSRRKNAERKRGPFMTLEAAAAAFLPVKPWPTPQKRR